MPSPTRHAFSLPPTPPSSTSHVSTTIAENVTTRLPAHFMARHHPSLFMCRNLPGKELGQVCANCDGRCILCDSHANLNIEAKICDDCTVSVHGKKCVLCQATAVASAYYCDECVELELDRDGCPKITDLGSLRSAKHFSHKVPVSSTGKGLSTANNKG